MEAPYPILHYVVRKFGFLLNEGTSVWNFVTNSGLGKFHRDKSVMLSAELLDGRVTSLLTALAKVD